jgi:hypothetical protein
MPPPPATRTARCGFCSALLAPGPGGWIPAAADAQEEPLLDPHRQRVWVGGHRYALLGRIAQGESTDVFLARRDGRLTERVLIKILRTDGDEDLLENEWRVIEKLEKSHIQGTPYFSGLLPQRVSFGVARLGKNGNEGQRRASVFRWRSGFVHSMNDVYNAHPSGIMPEAAVWMWKRMLETMGWFHQTGYIHGAILPQHTLIHARDHGVAFVGWSSALRSETPLTVVNNDLREYYPEWVWERKRVYPDLDIAMSARLLLRALGGSIYHAPSHVPQPLASLLERHARGDGKETYVAWTVRDQLDRVAGQVFGPSKFIPFSMPGWKS